MFPFTEKDLRRFGERFRDWLYDKSEPADVLDFDEAPTEGPPANFWLETLRELRREGLIRLIESTDGLDGATAELTDAGRRWVEERRAESAGP